MFRSKTIRKYLIVPIKIVWISIKDITRHDGVEQAGYLAFLLILSLFPFLIFLIAIIDVFGYYDTAVKVIHVVLYSLPTEVAKALVPYVEGVVLGPPHSLLTIAIIGVIWTASSSVEGYRSVLNRAYRVTSPPHYFLRRLISIGEFLIATLGMAFVVVTLVFIPALLERLKEVSDIDLSYLKDHLQPKYTVMFLREIMIFVFLTLLTSLLYYVLPNLKQKFYRTLPGSIITVILWLLVGNLFSIYLEKFSQFNFLYGSLAGIIAAIIFFHITSFIFILGAEVNYHFNRVYFRLPNLLKETNIAKYRKYRFY